VSKSIFEKYENYQYNKNEKRIIIRSVQKYIDTIDELRSKNYNSSIEHILVSATNAIEDGEEKFQQQLGVTKKRLVIIQEDPSIMLAMSEDEVATVRMFLYDIVEELNEIPTENIESNIDALTNILKKMMSEAIGRDEVNETNFAAWFMA